MGMRVRQLQRIDAFLSGNPRPAPDEAYTYEDLRVPPKAAPPLDSSVDEPRDMDDEFPIGRGCPPRIRLGPPCACACGSAYAAPLNSLWRAVRSPAACGRGSVLTMENYMRLYMRLFRALRTSFSEAEAVQIATSDWRTDSGGNDAITRCRFVGSLTGLAAKCVHPAVGPHPTGAFLQVLAETITEPDSGMLRPCPEVPLGSALKALALLRRAASQQAASPPGRRASYPPLSAPEPRAPAPSPSPRPPSSTALRPRLSSSGDGAIALRRFAAVNATRRRLGIQMSTSV